MEGAADAIAAGIADAHMQRGATQMKPREVAEKGQRYSETKRARERGERGRERGGKIFGNSKQKQQKYCA